MQTFFTFPDRALKYDCPSCGAHCCKGNGLALEAQEEVTRFARLEPRLASMLHPLNSRFAQVTDMTDGCWFLQSDGWCSVELEHGYATKPHTCRLFPFNRIFSVGDARIVDFNSKICPLQDAADARDGQSWDALLQQIDAEPFAGRGNAREPAGGAQHGWLGLEGRIRDAIDLHLREPDYALFAALQEEAALAHLKGQPEPQPNGDRVLARAEYLRKILTRWRTHHGVADDADLPRASAAAARQAALLTCSWRLSVLLRSDAAPWPSEIQLLPKRILAASHLLELSHLGRRKTPGLRAATETWQAAAPLLGLLAFWTRKVSLAAPLQIECAREAQPALDALSSSLLSGAGRALGESVDSALSPYPRELRALALSALAFGDAELHVE